MSSLLRDELLNLKSKLESLEGELTNQMMELEVKAENWHKLDEEADELVKKRKNVVVTLNVGGKLFQTKLDTLMSFKDTLFYKLVLSKKLELNKEIFIDRNYTYFHYILSYLRNKKLMNPSLSSTELNELIEEAEFYEIDELVLILNEMIREIKYVKFEYSGPYVSGTTTAGTNNIDDLNNFEDRTLKKGICAVHPGWIILELNREVEIEECEIGGWNGNTGIWAASNGSGSQIQTSTDKNNWTTVGNIPTNYASVITTVKLTKTKGKYVKFLGTSYLGIGYFKIKKI